MSISFFLSWFRHSNFFPDIFKFDSNFLENEEKYKEIKAEILGEGSSEEESGPESDSEGDEGTPVGIIYTCMV